MPRRAARATQAGVSRAVDRALTSADAGWNRLFERSLGPRLTKWLETSAPKPILLSQCLVRLAQKHEQLPELERFIEHCMRRFESDVVLAAVSKALPQLPPHPPHAQARLLRTTLKLLPPDLADSFGEHHIDMVWSHPATRRVLARAQYRLGKVTRPLEILDALDEPSAAFLRSLSAEGRALAQGVPLSPPSAGAATGDRIMYVVAHSLPHHSIGYSIRTQRLVEHVRASGWSVEVFARHGYPSDRSDFATAPIETITHVDGVPHHFSPDSRVAELDLLQSIEASAARLVEQAGTFEPSVIHAASDYRVGLAAIDAARRLGVPSIYEMRGLWHYSRAAKRDGYFDSEHFQMCHRLELQAAQSADRVLVNGDALRDLLVTEGIDKDRIAVVPNGVDIERFQPRLSDGRVRRELGLGETTVVGFIGSFFAFEGIDLLLQAAASLRQSHGDQLRFILVGDGPERKHLEQLAAELDLGQTVRFTGRVAHEQIFDYYSAIDIAVYPRRGLPVCELVAPLKPLEAMAMAKPVVVSSAAALASLVEPGTTGLVHDKDDAHSLARAIDQLHHSPVMREQLGAAGCQHVQQRTWLSSARTIADIYRDLGAQLTADRAGAAGRVP